MDCIVHGVAKSRTGPSDFHFTSLLGLVILVCAHMHGKSLTSRLFAFQAPLCMGFPDSRGSSQPRDRTQALMSPALAG